MIPIPRPLHLVASLLVFGVAPLVSAVTCTGVGLGVSLSSSPLAFGTYTVLAQSTANQVVTLTCKSTVANEGSVTWRLRLSAGSGSLVTRTMTGATNVLNYNIFTTAAFANVWGDTNATDITNATAPYAALNFTGQPSGTVRSVAVTGYGRIVAAQDLNAASYTTTAMLQAEARVPNTGAGTLYNSAAFNTTATLAANCLIDSVGNVPFGVYDPQSLTPVDVTSNLVTRCTKNTTYSVALDKGASLSYSPRKMDSAGANLSKLDYNLYTDSGHTIIWGDGGGGTSLPSASGAGILSTAAVTRQIFGRLFAGQDQSADTYSDTITVTVSY